MNSTSGSVAGTDTKVTKSVSGLSPNRIHEYRWVSWQALQLAPGATVDYDATTRYWTASAPLKIKTLP